MAQLRVSMLAQSDATSIARDLALKAGVSVAAKYIAAFDKVYSRLLIYPESGPLRPAIGKRIGMAVVPPYAILYEFEESIDTVTILRIVHGRRKMTGEMLHSDF